MRKLSSLVLLWIILPINVYLQDTSLNFDHVNKDQGLSNSWIRCIYQDDRGYIWFGTIDGLNRYNGYECEVYRPQSTGKNNLGNIHVYDILDKGQNELWVCTDLGVYIFDYERAVLRAYPLLKRNAVKCVQRDHSGNLWFGTSSGLFEYNPVDSSLREFQHLSSDPTSLSDSYINTIYEDAEKNLWVGTADGLNLFLRDQERFIRFYAKNEPNTLSSNEIMTITSDRQERLWVGTARGGLDILQYDLPGNTVKVQQILVGNVLDLLIDSRNILWIARGPNQGLERLDLNTFREDRPPKLVPVLHDPLNPKSLSENSHFCVYMDNANDIWIGTFGSGADYFSYRTKNFNTVKKLQGKDTSLPGNLVNTFVEDADFLWIGTEAGLSRYDKKSNIYTNYSYNPEDKNSLGADAVYALEIDSENNLWIGTWGGGLNRYDRENKKFVRYMPGKDSTGLKSTNIFTIYEDERGYVWMGTIGGGLSRLDKATGKFITYLSNPGNQSTLFNDAVNFIAETSDGDLLLSTYHSLGKFNYESNDFTHLLTAENDSVIKKGAYIISFFEDSRKNIWLATNMGVEVFDSALTLLNYYTIQHGLPDNTIQGILEGSRGDIWLTTNKGLSKLKEGITVPENPSFITYTEKDGIPSNEFKKRAVFKDSQGRFYMGTSKGFTHFHPDSIVHNYIVPKTIISEILILNSLPDESDKYTSIGQNVNEFDVLELSYKKSDFIIRFASLNFLNPEKNQYKYKLEGYDSDWIAVENQRTATYTNLHHGTYLFKVIGSNNDGIWSDHPKTLKIKINPPWWRTSVFRISIVLVAFVLAVLLYRLRFAMLEEQQKELRLSVSSRSNELAVLNTQLEEKQARITAQNVELEKHRNELEALVRERTSELEKAKEKAEESDRLKSSFLANMSHEIRTPMNAIVGFATLLRERKMTEEERNHYINVIVNNCESLLVLIDDIVDVSLIEANQLTLSQDIFIVNSTLKEIENYYQLKNKKQIEITYINREETGELVLSTDKIRFRQVFNNLLNNALKYTHEGRIEFGYEVQDKHILFFVSDTGVGIPEVYHRKIFNHFQKIEKNKSRRLYRGAGIGLSICKKIVELMGGKIWVESIVDQGSVFYFTVPRSQVDTVESNEAIMQDFTNNLDNVTVLIAEDDELNFEIFDKILAISGANVVWAKNGIEAIEFVENNTESDNLMIIMDLKMPDMDGYEAHSKIKALNPSIPVIAVTAYAQLTDRKRVLEEGFRDYLAKPVNPSKLLNLLSKYAPKRK